MTTRLTSKTSEPGLKESKAIPAAINPTICNPRKAYAERSSHRHAVKSATTDASANQSNKASPIN